MPNIPLIKKLAKRTKLGTYDPNEVVAALNDIQPGWTIADAVEAMPFRSDGGNDAVHLDKDAIGAAGFSGAPAETSVFGTEIGVRWRFGGTSERYKDAVRPTDEVIKKAVNEVLKQLTENFTVSKSPTNPQVGQSFIEALPKHVVEWDEDHDAWKTVSVTFKLTGVKIGTMVVNITSPGGLKISLRSPNSPSLWSALYKTDIAERAQKYLDNPDVKAADSRREELRHVKDAAGNVGSCPVCAQLQKLSWSRKNKDGHPTMVLHGYARPGHGYIVGDCFGVAYPPFELSTEGAVAWKLHLEQDMLVSAKEKLARAKLIQKLTLWLERGYSQPRDQIELMADGSIKTTDNTASSSELAKRGEHAHDATQVERDPKKYFELLKQNFINKCERNIANITEEITAFTAKIAGWLVKPLPGLSDEDKKLMDEHKSGQCPGSGTTNHSAAGRRVRWAKCEACGQNVSVTSLGKLRAHPFVKKSVEAAIVDALRAAADALSSANKE